MSKEVEISGHVPQAVAEALLAAQLEMPSLRKEGENKFGKYRYVSIDMFYAEVPKIAAKHGLFWQAKEVEWSLVGEKGNHIAYTYTFDLGFKDGAFLPGYGRLTIIHPIQGAQTAGSALSYAEKLFMRCCFKIVTGEEDADATDNSHREELKPERPKAPKLELKNQEAPAKVEAQAQTTNLVGGIAHGGVKVTDKDGTPIIAPAEKKDGWSHVAAVFTTFAPQCTTEQELKDFWDENLTTIDKMKADDPVIYKTVADAFKATKKQIKENK